MRKLAAAGLFASSVSSQPSVPLGSTASEAACINHNHSDDHRKKKKKKKRVRPEDSFDEDDDDDDEDWPVTSGGQKLNYRLSNESLPVGEMTSVV